MKGVIDADTHIAESAAIWELIDREMYPRRPVYFSITNDTLYGPRNGFWLIDGNIFPKPLGKGGFRLITPSQTEWESKRTDVQIACREMTDIPARLADMDRLGIQQQVVYPTLFLVYVTEDPTLEVALCRAYNQFLSEACAKSNGRIRWVAVPPLLCIEAAVTEIRRAKELGAVGVFFRGMEGDRMLDDPYFFPVYKEAEALGLPICIHTGAGSPRLAEIHYIERSASFPQSRVLPPLAFRNLIGNNIPRQFPTLRWGFIEAAALWVPYVLHAIKRVRGDKDWSKYGPSLFEENNLFIACEADEDIPYLLNWIGEDHIIIGSDYGHNDPSEEARLVATMRERGDLSQAQLDKIMSRNPARLYGL
jgi:predicted TIM-barrel fold metal-dependent hydrolase